MIENETKIEKRFAKQGDKKETDNYKFSYQDDERLDTIGGDDDEDMYDFQDEYADEEEEGKIQVDLDNLPDYKDEFEEEKVELSKFISKDRGLADLETGSEVYMSEMLGFEIEDAEEMEE